MSEWRRAPARVCQASPFQSTFGCAHTPRLQALYVLRGADHTALLEALCHPDGVLRDFPTAEEKACGCADVGRYDIDNLALRSTVECLFFTAMKRRCKQANPPTALSALPNDMIAVILARDGWKSCGPLARTSRSWMRRLTAPGFVLRLIAETASAQDELIHETLPAWLFYALPGHLVGDAPAFTWSQYAAGRTDLVFPLNLLHEKYFYTGGDVAQRLHGKTWQADVDVWTTDAQLRVAKLADGDTTHNWDFVFKSDAKAPTQRCIETFDLSVVQQGFLQAGYDAEPVFYTTPLAVCSLVTKRLFIAIDPLCLGADYEVCLTGHDAVRVRVTIFRMIVKHHQGHHHTKQLDCGFSLWGCRQTKRAESIAYRERPFQLNAFFENCELCMATLMEKEEAYEDSQTCGHDVEHYLVGNNKSPVPGEICRWTQRVMKYRNRFAEYAPRYVVNPLVRRAIEAEEARLTREAKQRACDACHDSTVEPRDGVYGPCHACSDRELAELLP